MSTPTMRLASILLVTTAALAISACSSDSTNNGTVASAPTGGTTGTTTGGTTTGDSGSGTTTTTQLTLATAPVGTTLNLNAHQGLEAYTITNGEAVNAGAALPSGSFQSNPDAVIVTTASGYTMTLPDAKTVTVDTSAASTQSVGAQSFHTTVNGGGNMVNTTLTNGATSGLTYSTYGTWTETDPLGNPVVSGTIATGIQTTTSQMPVSGTASYSGRFTGSVTSAVNSGNITDGSVALQADFAGNTINGGITGIKVTDANNTFTGTMNDISLSSGVISNAGFTGVASTSNAFSTSTINVPGLTGSFGGKFYGPGAAEAAGSIALTGANGTVIGAFGVKKN